MKETEILKETISQTKPKPEVKKRTYKPRKKKEPKKKEKMTRLGDPVYTSFCPSKMNKQKDQIGSSYKIVVHKIQVPARYLRYS